jgi:hypothetical protein
MLTIMLGAVDSYDEAAGTFSTQGGTELQLEHSLVSLSKWEKGPFWAKMRKLRKRL